MYSKLLFDTLLMVLFLAALAHGLWGNTAHEWIGLTVFVCLVAHNVLNRRWYRTVVFVYKKSMPWRWIVSMVCTLMLIIVCVGLLISSVLHSQQLLTFFPVQQSIETRQWHTLTAYWCLVLASLHAGMHWQTVRIGVRRVCLACGINGIKATQRMQGTNRLRVWLFRVLTGLVVLYGLLFSFDRQVGAKLMGLVSFDYWDFEQNLMGFFIGYACVMGLYAWVGRGIMVWLQRR